MLWNSPRKECPGGFGQQFRGGFALAPITEPVAHEPQVREVEQQVGELAPQIGTAVLIERDVRHVGEPDPGFAHTIGDRFGGKAGPVLDPPKPLFLGRGNEHAISNKRCG